MSKFISTRAGYVAVAEIAEVTPYVAQKSKVPSGAQLFTPCVAVVLRSSGQRILIWEGLMVRPEDADRARTIAAGQAKSLLAAIGGEVVPLPWDPPPPTPPEPEAF